MSEITEETFTEKVEAEARPVEKPEGSPDLVPFKAVPRRKRAEMMRQLEKVQESQAALEAVRGDDTEGEGSSPALAAAVFDLIAECEEMLTHAAHDVDAYTAWAAAASDDDVMGLFGWYVSRFQVGE